MFTTLISMFVQIVRTITNLSNDAGRTPGRRFCSAIRCPRASEKSYDARAFGCDSNHGGYPQVRVSMHILHLILVYYYWAAKRQAPCCPPASCMVYGMHYPRVQACNKYINIVLFTSKLAFKIKKKATT